MMEVRASVFETVYMPRIRPELALTTTLIAHSGYYDEQGKWVIDDPNVITTRYTCTNGHSWEEKTGGR